jgi:hypothetical protein
MKIAPLQLVDYFLTELTIVANPDFDAAKPIAECVESLVVTPHYSLTKENEDRSSEWLVSLEISQTIAEGANLPYSFTLRIQGTVAASPHLMQSKLQRAIHANGPAMLFGAAREIIRAATGRGPWAAVIIPSTNFLTDLPPLPTAHAPEAQSTAVKKPKAAATKPAAKVAKQAKSKKS